jgi:ABC-2 type transport system permease protein
MRELLLIVRREFRERVRSRAFVIGTIAFPLFMIAVMALPRLTDRTGAERALVVVDEAPGTVGSLFIATLTAPPDDAAPAQNRYTAERVEGPFDAIREQLNARVQAEEIDGYVVLPAAILDDSQVLYRARNIASFTVLRDIRQAASRAAQAERLRVAGLQSDELAALLRPVEVETARITTAGTEGAGAESTFWIAYVVALLIYFMVAFYGMSVLRSVLEEKTTRIAEVLASSVKGMHLMMGKIIGVGAAALLQVGIWAVVMVLVLTQSDVLASQFGMPAGMLGTVAIEPLQAVTYLAFFVLGFLLFAAIFAALGAAVTSDQEAQSLQMVGMVPLVVPLLFLMQVTTEPLGAIATTLGLVPFTAPIAMPMRMAAAPIPPLEIAGSLLLLALAVVVVAWLAGKVYRIGILSTGRKPTLVEVIRWLRMA